MSKVLMTFLVLVAGLTVPACSLLPQQEEQPAQQPVMGDADTNTLGAPEIISADDEIGTDSGNIAATFTLAEVESHTTKDDCWTVINGQVYDLTSVTSADAHPGGPVIEQACGADGTALFTERNGKGPHPERAQMGLENLIIGVLAE